MTSGVKLIETGDAQSALSQRTVACYRDAILLFLAFVGGKLGKVPSALRLSDIQSDLILAFLDHLQRERQCAVRTRNLRLTALRALFLGSQHALDLPAFVMPCA